MARAASKSVAKPNPAKKAAQAEVSTGFSSMTLAEKITWISLHVMLFLVPIAVSNLSWLGIGNGLPLTFDQFDIAKLFVMRACTIVAAAAWLVSFLLRGGRVRFNKVDWLILGFLVWVGITTITSIHWPTALFGKYRRFEGLLSFINYAVVFFLIVQTVDRPSRMRSLIRTLFFSGVLVMIYSVLQYLGVELIQYGKLPFEARRSFATYGNPDLLAGFIILMLPLSISLALSEDRVVWRTIYWIGSILTAITVITAFTRSAWVAAPFAVGALLIAAFRQKLRPKTEDWVMGAVAAAAAGIVIVRSLSAPSEVMNVVARIKSIFVFNEGSAATRFQIWQAAIDAIKDRPIFGFGADTFRLVFPKYKPIAYVAAAGYLSVADNVHNYVLQMATALGIPGVILLYSIFAWMLVASFRGAFSKESGGSRIVYAGVWAAALGYLVHLFFGLSVTGTTVLLWMCFGLLLAPLAENHEVKAPSTTVGTLGAVLVVAIAAVLFVGNIVYVAADNAYLVTKLVPMTGDDRIAMAQKAIRLNPYNDMYRAELAQSYVEAARQVLQSGQQTQETYNQGFNLLKQGEMELRKTIDFVPSEYDNYVFLVNVYNLMGSYFGQPKYFDEAIRYAERGIRDVETYGPALRLEYARALLSVGRNAEGIAQTRYAIKMDPNYTQAYMVLAEAYFQQGKYDEALQEAKTARAQAESRNDTAMLQEVDAFIQRAEASATAAP